MWKIHTCFAFGFKKIMELSLEKLETVPLMTEHELIKIVCYCIF